MIQILSFLLSPLGRIVAAVLGIAVFISAFAFDQRSRAVAKIERQTNEAVSKAHRARSDSAASRGVLDPYAAP